MVDATNASTVTPLPLDVAQLRDYLHHAADEGRLHDAIDVVIEAILKLRTDNADLARRLASALRQAFGRRSEKYDPNQLLLLLDALPPAQVEKAIPEPLRPKPTVVAPPKTKPRPAPHGRKPLPAHLPRVPEVSALPEKDRLCDKCGCDKAIIGYETSEVLDWEPGHFLVRLIQREKGACPHCRDGVVTAPQPDKLVERGRVGAGLLADILVNKFQDHCPLNRMVDIYQRHGVKLNSSTLADWVAAGADAFGMVYQAMVKCVTTAYLVGTDDTGLPVLDTDHPNGIKLGHLWAYVADGKLVVFDYTPDRKMAGPRTFLEKRTGKIQCDGYQGYARIAKDSDGRVVRAGCWAHARRKFVEAAEAGDARAAIAVTLIAALYKVERDATDAGLGPDERAVQRQAVAAPVMKKLHEWLLASVMDAPPKTPLGAAVNYALNQWDSLQVYLTDGLVPIDNNGVERAIRPIAVGRGNYLFAGSDNGAKRAAVLYSILGTCRLVGVDPYVYIRDVLITISKGWPQERIGELLPGAWAATHPPAEPPA